MRANLRLVVGVVIDELELSEEAAFDHEGRDLDKEPTALETELSNFMLKLFHHILFNIRTGLNLSLELLYATPHRVPSPDQLEYELNLVQAHIENLAPSEHLDQGQVLHRGRRCLA